MPRYRLHANCTAASSPTVSQDSVAANTYASKDGKEARRRCFHACRGIGPCNSCSHAYRRAIHRRVLRRDRRQPPLGIRRGAALQVQRHRLHAHLLRRHQRAAGPQRHQHRPHHGRRQREPRRLRLRPQRRGRLGPEIRQGLPGRLLPLHRRRQRGRRQRHAEHPPRHAERQQRARRSRTRQHQGVHGGAERRHSGVPALPGHIQLRRVLLHDAHRAVPRHHRRAAPRQRVPLLLLRREQGADRHQLRALHLARHGGAGRQQRVPEPLRCARRHLLLRAGERRRRERQDRRVRERLAVRRRRRGHHDQRADVQPEPHQPCWAGHAQAPWGHGGLYFRHVQREQERWRRDGEAFRTLQPGQVAGVPH